MIHKNLSCYNNYEIFDNNELEKQYRESKLSSSNSHVNFVKNIFDNQKINAVELGSGNSKTLYKLSISNILNYGFGFEISKTRHEFAEKWKKDLEINNVENIFDNFLNLKNYQIKNVDLFFVVDLAFQFCEPIEKGSDKKILCDIYDLLNHKGKLILELDGCGKIINSSKINNKIWEEFDSDDPWQFSLWNCNYNEKNQFLNWDKIFINRNENKKDFSSVILKIYKKEKIKNLLNEVGFKKINFYQDWDFSEMKTDKTNFIIVAEK
jgi:SAM-dependent methyltransferase